MYNPLVLQNICAVKQKLSRVESWLRGSHIKLTQIKSGVLTRLK
jgi:hypothetical protein